ncbi:DNA adenine methylase [Acinetobacter baumannii]|nr:DNA adenine methylase [Acinetobacter baumannii]MCG6630377.1 DNA adenine methylase [Acinetobacter baumannii]MCG6637804.1 DNA adenine methylase [Acinetobacter baumannii]HAV2955609.1 DNA adenine methylase [Acinetobacter baumannii]
MNTMNHPLIRYHGGKFRLAPWVLSHFPNHTCYTEAFGGAAGVLLQKPRAYAEVYNDLDGEIVNLFRVLRNEEHRNKLIEQLVFTPYSRDDFQGAWEPCDDPIEKARRLIVRAQMGFGSAGATKGITGFRIDTKRAYGTAQSLWMTYPNHLAIVGQRLSGVLIENRQAIQVLQDHDDSETLHYVDPPYVHETRYSGAKNGRVYRHEMSDQDHEELLKVLLELEGKVIVSGYPSELYNDYLAKWKRVDTSARISSGRGTDVRTECLWISPNAQHQDLFGGIHV